MTQRKIWIAALLLLVFTTLPLLIASAENDPMVFGGFLFNPIDGNTYLAKMYQGFMGGWRFILPYTAEPGQGAYLFLFYLALGHLARILHLPLILVFHLARILAAALLVFFLARFYSRIFGEKQRLAWLSLLLSLFASGMGWAAVLAGSFPSDMWVAEAYPFLAAYANPHFPLGLALMLAILLRLLKPMDARGRVLLLVLGLLLSIIMPFGVVILAVICTIWFVWGWIANRGVYFQDLVTLVCLFSGGGASLLYQYLATLRDPVLSGWNIQNVTTSPPLWDVLLSLSPALLFGLLALPGLWKKQAEPASRLLLTWFLAGVLLIYMPFSLQRRFMLGIYIPVAACGVLGMARLAQNRLPVSRLFAPIFVLSVLTNAGVLAAGWAAIQTRSPLFYLTFGEKAAMEWITGNTPVRALVLSSPDMGLFLPAHTGRCVIYGHPFETVNAAQEQHNLLNFYASEQTGSARTFLDQRGVDYIFYGPREEMLGHPAILDELDPVYNQAGVMIYRVAQSP